MTITTNELAVMRTKLANQRTYLAYMRTGLAIAGIAGIFKKKKILFFGIFMIITSAFQYYALNKNINDNENVNHVLLDYLPLIYVVLSIGILYLQVYYK